jgi:hypothetical protein
MQTLTRTFRLAFRDLVSTEIRVGRRFLESLQITAGIHHLTLYTMVSHTQGHENNLIR